MGVSGCDTGEELVDLGESLSSELCNEGRGQTSQCRRRKLRNLMNRKMFKVMITV
jgi:hypothetical protein